jgi:hypothetical protein
MSTRIITLKNNITGAWAGSSDTTGTVTMSDTDTDDSDDPESTSSISRRWIFTNDLLAFILLSSLPVVTALGATQILALGQVPEAVVLAYLGISGTAAVWAFGADALEAWRSK